MTAISLAALFVLALGIAACTDGPTAPKTPQALPPTPTPTPVPIGNLTLSGVIYDWEGGTVGSRGFVYLESGPQQGTTVQTDANGKYEFDRLSPGTFKVRAGAAGFFRSTKTISLTTNATLDFTLDSP
jgi:hypothetical protein